MPLGKHRRAYLPTGAALDHSQKSMLRITCRNSCLTCKISSHSLPSRPKVHAGWLLTIVQKAVNCSKHFACMLRRLRTSFSLDAWPNAQASSSSRIGMVLQVVASHQAVLSPVSVHNRAHKRMQLAMQLLPTERSGSFLGSTCRISQGREFRVVSQARCRVAVKQQEHQPDP